MLLLFFSGFVSPLRSQSRGFGLGAIIGEPTGISMKNWLSRDTALDIALAWSFEGDNSFTIHGDYLTHRFHLISVRKGRLPLYFGLGGRIKFDGDDVKVGIRVPVGLNYLFENAPLDLFLEVVPRLELVPDTEVNLNAAVGIRYFFGR